MSRMWRRRTQFPPPNLLYLFMLFAASGCEGPAGTKQGSNDDVEFQLVEARGRWTLQSKKTGDCVTTSRAETFYQMPSQPVSQKAATFSHRTGKQHSGRHRKHLQERPPSL